MTSATMLASGCRRGKSAQHTPEAIVVGGDWYRRTDGSGDGQDVSQETVGEAGHLGHIWDLALLDRCGQHTEEEGWQSQNRGELHLAGGWLLGGFK